MDRYLGLYWTLPVPWAGFTALPKDVEEAAKLSRTVAYQRRRVRRWVAEEGGTLVHEEVFLELAPDRGTAHVLPTVDRLLARAEAEDARLVLVDFAEAFGWRRHGPLFARLAEHPERHVLLDPAPLLDDAGAFDPVAHFRAWRALEAAHAASKPQRRAALAAAIAERQSGHPSLAALAAALNGEGLRTPSGKARAADNLRKFMASV